MRRAALWLGEGEWVADRGWHRQNVVGWGASVCCPVSLFADAIGGPRYFWLKDGPGLGMKLICIHASNSGPLRENKTPTGHNYWMCQWLAVIDIHSNCTCTCISWSKSVNPVNLRPGNQRRIQLCNDICDQTESSDPRSVSTIFKLSWKMLDWAQKHSVRLLGNSVKQ